MVEKRAQKVIQRGLEHHPAFIGQGNAPCPGHVLDVFQVLIGVESQGNRDFGDIVCREDRQGRKDEPAYGLGGTGQAAEWVDGVRLAIERQSQNKHDQENGEEKRRSSQKGLVGTRK